MANNFRDTNNFQDESIERILAANIGRVVTIFTKSGGASGCGFTGLIVRVDCDVVKLTTRLPCAPAQPFEDFCGNRNFGFRRCCGSHELGTTCIIPLNAIASVIFNEI